MVVLGAVAPVAGGGQAFALGITGDGVGGLGAAEFGGGFELEKGAMEDGCWGGLWGNLGEGIFWLHL